MNFQMRNGVSAQVWGAVAVVFLAAASISGARAEYRLSVGDVVDISIFGIPELRTHAKVNMDGEVSFPLIGETRVAGLTVPELRVQLQKRLVEEVLGQTATPGRSSLGRITPNEIVVELAEYRPVYISGDVVHSGEQPYRPGLTARQLISLAGGYDVSRGKTGTDPADLRTEYAGLWVEYAREQAHVERLKAGLTPSPSSRSPQLAAAGSGRLLEVPASQGTASRFYEKLLVQLSGTPVSADLLSQIARSETDQLAGAEADFAKERQYLTKAIADADNRLSFGGEQEQRTKSEIELSVSDMTKIRTLFDKGWANMERLASSRRDVFAARNQLLQTSVQVAQMKKEREELARKLDKLEDDRHLTFVRELEDANIKLTTVRNRLQSVGEKLAASGVQGNPHAMRQAGIKPSIIIFRKTNDIASQISGGEDASLLPGDVVEVMLRADRKGE